MAEKGKVKGVKKKIDAKNRETLYKYDLLGRLKKIERVGELPEKNTLFKYDNCQALCVLGGIWGLIS